MVPSRARKHIKKLLQCFRQGIIILRQLPEDRKGVKQRQRHDGLACGEKEEGPKTKDPLVFPAGGAGRLPQEVEEMGWQSLHSHGFIQITLR